MSTAVYMRVSTEEQRERQTIETQRQYATDYCRLNQIREPRFFADDGVSGTVPFDERPAGHELLQAARQGEIKTVLVYRLDRLGRSPLVILRTIEQLEEAGVQLRSMTEPIDTSTGAGRFLINILSAVAGLERDTIIERSKAGTERLAHAGTWLGGIVPYGYRTVGEDASRRLVLSEDHLPGQDLSEVDVIRMIYEWCAEERLSCFRIAERLNHMRIPPSYVRDERHITRGKRKVATAGIWRAGRIRNMLVSPTYKGVHQYGKRPKGGEPVIIERPCPPIVTEEVWNRAQVTLQLNRRFSPRNSKRDYLLRGLIKCGLCGLTFTGHSARPYKDGSPRHYYTCNGRRAHRGIYAAIGQRCPSKPVEGRAVEQIVMDDILEFLERPETVMSHLAAEIEDEAKNREAVMRQRERWEKALKRTHGERERLIGLYRKQLVTDQELEAQFAEISEEQAKITGELERLGAAADAVERAADYMAQADALLQELRQCLSRPLTPQVWRQLVEALVRTIVVDTVERYGKPTAKVKVVYAFTPPSSEFAVASHTGTRESRTYNILHDVHLKSTRRRKGGGTDANPNRT